jgi:uncharacterized protein (TIGR00369 family)
MAKTVFDPSAAGWAPFGDRGFMDHAGPVWVFEEDGRRRYALLAEQRHVNSVGTVHGAAIASFAEFALAIESRNASAGAPIVTVQLDIHYLGALNLGEFVEADCEIVKSTRDLNFVEGRFRVGSRLIATAKGVSKVRRKG